MATLNVPDYANKTTVALASAEVWQVSGGPVRLQTAAPVSERDGILLQPGIGHQFAAAENVTVWLASPLAAEVVRMAVK